MKATIVVKKRSRGLTDELVTAIEQKLVKVKVNKDSDCNTFGRRRGDCVDTLGNYTGVPIWLCSNKKEWWKKMDLTLKKINHHKDPCFLLLIEQAGPFGGPKVNNGYGPIV